MGRVVKVLLGLIGGFVALFALAALLLYLFFDPNDFREDIARSVKNQTGRDLIIEGDISLDLFPWLAVEVGKASLGNAPGFGDEPMASFDRASFSVRLLPAILSQEVVVGAADIEGLRLNLTVNSRGTDNWSDLIAGESGEALESPGQIPPDPGSEIDVNSIEIIDASVRYSDERTGALIVVDGLNLKTGRLRSNGEAVPIRAALNLDIQPEAMSGTFEIETEVAFDLASGIVNLAGFQLDGTLSGLASIPTRLQLLSNGIEVSTNDSRISMQPLDLSVLDMHIVADVQPFSYENTISPKAAIEIDEFSPRTLMSLFEVDPPETADPSVLSRVSVNADFEMTPTAYDLRNVTITMDDTTFTGALSVPSGATGSYQFDLSGDSIDLARYMEPASENAGGDSAEEAPVEIPVDLIKPLNARGKFKIARATLGDLVFENIDVGVNASNGRLRIFPISSGLFGGTYTGDVRVDVSGPTPALSMNEKIAGVDLAKLANAMFEKGNVSGEIGGSFVLSGKGADMTAIQRNLAGNMSLLLEDGAFIGTDVWYEIRRARALLKRETPPEPTLPAKTNFSTVSMTGLVADGIMKSDDLFAELPFMQLSGGGQVDIAAATVNYSLTARILERPEFLRNATPEELDEFTEAVIPLKVKGPLSSPSITPDLQKLLQKQVEDEIKDKLKDKLKGLFD